jgi:hypothetical protein
LQIQKRLGAQEPTSPGESDLIMSEPQTDEITEVFADRIERISL